MPDHLYQFGAIGIRAREPLDHILPNLPSLDTIDITTNSPLPASQLLLVTMVHSRQEVASGSAKLTYSFGGRYNLEVFSTKSGYLFTSRIGAAFAVDHNGRELKIFQGDMQLTLLREILTAVIIPLVWFFRGFALIHGSAVQTPIGAVLFCGHSGAGKSTLAAVLGSKPGWWVIADDICPLTIEDGTINVRSTGHDLRLWSDSAQLVGKNYPTQTLLEAYGAKFRVSGPVGETRHLLVPSEVVAIFQINQPDPEDAPLVSPQITPIAAAERVVTLLRNAFVLDMTDQNVESNQFLFFADVASRIPVYELSYPRRYEAIQDIADLILDISPQVVQAVSQS